MSPLILNFGIACILACTLSGVFAADPPKFSTPEPREFAEDLRKAGPQDADYPLPQDQAKSLKQREDVQKWYREQLVVPYISGPDAKAKWAPKAKAALEACALYYSADRTFPRQTLYWEQCTHNVEDAVKAGCNDPLLNYYKVQHLDSIEQPTDRAEAYGKYLAALETAKAPPYVRAKVGLEQSYYLFVAARQAEQPKGKGKKAFEHTMRCLAELSKDHHPAAQDAVLDIAYYVLVNYRSAGWGRENGFLDLNEVLTDAGAPASLLHTLKGQFLVDHAWDARGNGFAGSVTDDNHSKFKSRLAEAQTAFEAAWAADDTQYAAAVGMITVCTGLGHKREVMEQWFQRSMTVNPNCYRACAAKLAYLEPKWHGSEEDTLAFGRQCLRTKNNHAGLPYLLVRAHRVKVRGSHKDFADYLGKHPVAWADVREYYENALPLWKTDRDLCTEYSVWCSGVGEWAAAKKHMAAIGNAPANDFFKEPKDFENYMKDINSHLKNDSK